MQPAGLGVLSEPGTKDRQKKIIRSKKLSLEILLQQQKEVKVYKKGDLSCLVVVGGCF